MAKRRHKKARHGRRKRRLSAKQRRAMMRNLRKARKALRGKRRRHGKRRKSRKSRKSRRRHGKRRSSSRRRRHGGGRRHGGLSNKAAQIYQQLIDRGRTPQQAHKVAARIDRMRTGRVKRYFEREAMQAKSKSQLANLFSGFGAAGHLAAQAR